MKYPYHCDIHGEFEIQAPIKEGPPNLVHCPVCHKAGKRIYTITEEHWHCQGSHKSDYDKHGDKVEHLNRSWSKHFGEKPPPPASDVPRNSSEPY